MTNKQARLMLKMDLNKPFTIEELTAKYRKLIKECHPDMHISEDKKSIEFYNKKSTLLNEAYAVLKSSLNNTDFINRKNAVLSKMKSRFENCKDSILKRQVVDIFSSVVFIDRCNDDSELDKIVKAFNTSVYACYQKYETDFRVRNRIPSNYFDKLNYDCSCDEFIAGLSGLQLSYDHAVENKINGILFTYFSPFDSVLSSPYLDNVIDDVKDRLHNYKLSVVLEEDTVDCFASYLRSVQKYFESVNLEYFKIKKLISKLPGSYTDNGTLKCKLLSKLNDSIFIGDFDSVKDEIMNCVYDKQDEIVVIKKLQSYLKLKSSKASIGCKLSSKSVDSNYVREMTDKCDNLIKMAFDGKYSLADISILENITFSDSVKDKMILSLLDNQSYSVYIKANDRLESDPFVLKSSNNEFLSVDDDSNVVISSSEEMSKDNDMLSLNEFVSYGKPIFRYISDGENVDGILYEYQGYELVYSYNERTGIIEGVYVRPITNHFGYNYGEKFDITSIINCHVKKMFRPYVRKIQKKSSNYKSLRIQRVGK